MKVGGLFEGLPSRNKNLFFISLFYSSVTSWVAYTYYKADRDKKAQDFIDFYRSCGHYKHPWIKNPYPVPEHVKTTDYPALAAVPSPQKY